MPDPTNLNDALFEIQNLNIQLNTALYNLQNATQNLSLANIQLSAAVTERDAAVSALTTVQDQVTAVAAERDAVQQQLAQAQSLTALQQTIIADRQNELAQVRKTMSSLAAQFGHEIAVMAAKLVPYSISPEQTSTDITTAYLQTRAAVSAQHLYDFEQNNPT